MFFFFLLSFCLSILSFFTVCMVTRPICHLTVGDGQHIDDLAIAFKFHMYCIKNWKEVIVRPLSTVGYTSVVASVIHSRQWSN